ncbi:COG4705 family protein [Dactylosporangium sp. CS-047395]|uniref:COG4705 family protein n=1 Tax=Dactylosporangium sp. CS-047395 TaxID=3239936 RepID=UPI003D937F6F
MQPRASTMVRVASKVPEVTVYFWIIKVLATTVGETAADLLNFNLGLGLGGTTLAMFAVLAGALVLQYRAPYYIPWRYWLVVVLVSIAGTLITDNLTDSFGVPLEVTTAVFAVALAVVFAWWYRSERTLSIHSISTRRRETFYWAAILTTFALGTAAGDLLAERLGLGYLLSAALFATVIAFIGLFYGLRVFGGVFAFWAAYVLTRPLGASLGDWVAQPSDSGGLNLGTVGPSIVCLLAVVVLVAYLTLSRRDEILDDGFGA